jgi:hypothetical protein
MLHPRLLRTALMPARRASQVDIKKLEKAEAKIKVSM